MEHRRGLIRVAAAGILAGAFALAPWALAATDSTALKGKDDAAGLIKEGSVALPFSLADIDNKAVSLESFAGKKVVLLAFWSFFCGPCREEIPLLDEVTKKYSKDGVEMLAINLDGPKMDKAVRKYMSSNGFAFRVLWEKIEGPKYMTADSYGVAGTPTVVLVGKDGKVSWAHVGRAESSKIEAEIKKALAAGG